MFVKSSIMLIMKNKLLIIVLALTVIVLTVLSVQAYNEYRDEERAEATRQMEHEQEVARIRQTQAAARENDYLNHIEYLLVQCRSGEEAYRELSRTQQARIEAPTCDRPTQ